MARTYARDDIGRFAHSGTRLSSRGVRGDSNARAFRQGNAKASAVNSIASQKRRARALANSRGVKFDTPVSSPQFKRYAQDIRRAGKQDHTILKSINKGINTERKSTLAQKGRKLAK